jgi:hypothetical protein
MNPPSHFRQLPEGACLNRSFELSECVQQDTGELIVRGIRERHAGWRFEIVDLNLNGLFHEIVLMGTSADA